MHTLENNTGNPIKTNYSFPNVKRKMNLISIRIGHSIVHLCLSGADSDSCKETADMGCGHQHMKLLAQQILEKRLDIIAYSSITTDRMTRDLLSN
ncbi:hypothetical protein AVEN_155420-1 [Araneus ventricosus]|uniref:Uncharacterized protein n=1 Tax=Araneus ventricosus TaxID=182803 RepID=A0A4Y2MPC0_ARAVE|nr:hypothetical protein AVEN_155420-1 [Araneus ventricosus]